MFAIIENKEKNKSIVNFVNTVQDFLDYVKKEIKNDNFIYLTNISLNEIEDEKIFKNNKYLINYNDNKIIYVEKIINIDRGYIYNSKRIEVNILGQWKLISNKIRADKIYIPSDYYD